MFDDGGIVIGTIGSILASILCFIAGVVFTKIKNRKKAKLYKRIKEANLRKFFYDRNVLNQDSGNVGADIRKAENEVYLIGSWLTSALSKELDEAICEKVEMGVEFHLCFNNLDYNVIKIYARYINSNDKDIIQSLYNTYQKLFEIKKSLPAESKNKIHIYSHNQMLTTAFWGIDIKHKKPKKVFYKLDHKVIKGEISHSYGFEYGYSKKCEFSNNIKDGYMFVLKNSTELSSISQLLSESSNYNDINSHNIIKEYFK